MNVKKQRVAMIVVTFFVLLSTSFLINKDAMTSSIQNETTPASLERYASTLLRHNATESIQDLPSYLSESELNTWLSSEHGKTRLLSHWILANEALRLSQFVEAEDYLRNALTLIDDSVSVELRAKLYFDLSLAQIKQNKVKESMKTFTQVSDLFEGYEGSHSDIFIRYFMKRSFEMSHQQSSSEELVGFWEDIHHKAIAVNYPDIDEIYYFLGTAYWNARQFVKGINLKIKAIELNLKRENNEQVQLLLTDIGIDYLLNGNHHEAINQLTKALEYNRNSEQSTPERLHYIYVKLYAAYSDSGDLVNAERVLAAAEEQLKLMHNAITLENYRTYLYAMKADFKRRQGEAENALSLIQLAKERHEGEFHARVYQFDVTLDMIFGDIYYLSNSIDKAIEHHKTAEKKIEERDLYYLEVSIHHKLYLNYLANDELTLALHHLSEEAQLQRNLRLEANEQYSQYVYNEFDSKTKEGRIAELEDSEEYSQWMLIALVVVLLSVISFAWALKSKSHKIVQLNALLTTLSNTDGLTSISNRRAFDDYVKKWNCVPLATQMRAIFMIDIDSFKKYNDYYGHAAGDKVIKSVAQTIKTRCRTTDFVARYGGEEFVVLMNDTTPKRVLDIAQSIQKAIKTLNMQHERSEVSEQVTVSIGILTCPKDVDVDAYELIKQADLALYQAKFEGRNQYYHIAYKEALSSDSHWAEVAR